MLGVYSLNDQLLNSKEELSFSKMILKEIKKYDVVVVSDYGHGLISKKSAKIYNRRNFYPPKFLPAEIYNR